jgi:hypothetical protein
VECAGCDSPIRVDVIYVVNGRVRPHKLPEDFEATCDACHSFDTFNRSEVKTQTLPKIRAKTVTKVKPIKKAG